MSVVVVVSLLLVIVRGRSEGVERQAVLERKGSQRQVAAKACEPNEPMSLERLSSIAFVFSCG
jgi:hypothetical protein